MKTSHIIGVLFGLLSTTAIIDCAVHEMQQRKGSAQIKTAANHPSRASPADSSETSIQISGTTNTVTVNGKILPAHPDTTDTQNMIYVVAEVNSITVIKNDQQSEVKISQKGYNNKFSISKK